MLAALAVALSLAVPSPGPTSLRPHQLPEPPLAAMPAQTPPEMDAATWMLWSVDLDAELWSRDPDARRPPASVTKVMTALLVVERDDLTAETVVSDTADLTPIGYVGQPEVVAGERWRIGDLFDFLVVKSGNDVAATLAEHVAGSEEAFVSLMNERAAELGMTGTTFRNPHGLDTDGHLSTARDLILLGRAAIAEPRLMQAASMWAITLDPESRDPIQMENTNKLLLNFPGDGGLKTGDTLSAGKVLLSYVDTGRNRLLGVVMGSVDHLAATRELMAYGWQLLDPRDHLLHPGDEAGLLDDLPAWERTRIAAAHLPLDPGTDRPGDPLTTPGARALGAALSGLLPDLVGGGS